MFDWMEYLSEYHFGEEYFYVCPHHIATGGYESCCACSGWADDDPDYGRQCTESQTKWEKERS